MTEVSVIICTYNRADLLEKTLEQLAKQTIAPDRYEIIIIDNRSTDHTSEVVNKFLATSKELNARYVLEEKQGLSHARNRGIEEAQSEILTYIDDDVLTSTDFVEQIIEVFKRQDVIGIGGKIIPKYESGVKPKWMSRYLLPSVSALDMGNREKTFKGIKFPIGANMSFRKKVFATYGTFNPELGRSGKGLEGGEEKDLFFRIKKHNQKILYAPKVVLEHVIPENRVQPGFIKNLAVGVGRSEKKRLSTAPFGTRVKKWLSELVKFGATFVLFIFYAIQLKFEAAFMLVKFRIWVLTGMLANE